MGSCETSTHGAITPPQPLTRTGGIKKA